MDNHHWCHMHWADVIAEDEIEHLEVLQAFNPSLSSLLSGFPNFIIGVLYNKLSGQEGVRPTERFRMAKISLVRHIRGFLGSRALSYRGPWKSSAKKTFLGGATKLMEGLIFQLTST